MPLLPASAKGVVQAVGEVEQLVLGAESGRGGELLSQAFKALRRQSVVGAGHGGLLTSR